MFKNILIVCTGNICRSPMCECILKQKLGDEFKVSSAGTGALTGQSIDPTAGELLKEHGINNTSHTARQINSSLLSKADLVIVMESIHKRDLTRKYPAMLGKIQLLGKWNNNQDVPDPYRQQRPAFEHVYKLINQYTDQWVQKLL